MRQVAGSRRAPWQLTEAGWKVDIKKLSASKTETST